MGRTNWSFIVSKNNQQSGKRGCQSSAVWTKIGKAAQNRENGQKRIQNLTVLENIQQFSKMQEEKWKDPWHQPCHAKKMNKQHTSVTKVVHRAISKKKKDNVWVYSGISSIHVTASRIFAVEKSWRSHCFALCGWHHNGWKSRIWLPCGRHWWKMWTLTNPHHSMTMYSWRMLGVNENRMNELSKKIQRSVSHSSTETEIIPLNAGLKLDGFPALDLLDMIVTIL